MRRFIPRPQTVAVAPGALLLWQIGVGVFAIPPDTLPTPATILTTIWSGRVAFAAAVGTTLAEAVIGLVFGTLIGMGSGILLSRFRLLERMFLPYLVASQAVPIIAFGAIIIMWFGNGISSKAIIGVYLSCFPVAINTVTGIRGVDANGIGLLRSFGAGTFTILFRLEIPTALPSIFTAIRLGASLALVGAIVGEWFGAAHGLGVAMLTAMFDDRVPQLWAAIVLTGVTGTVLYGAVVLLQRRIVWWQGAA